MKKFKISGVLQKYCQTSYYVIDELSRSYVVHRKISRKKNLLSELPSIKSADSFFLFNQVRDTRGILGSFKTKSKTIGLYSLGSPERFGENHTVVSLTLIINYHHSLKLKLILKN